VLPCKPGRFPATGVIRKKRATHRGSVSATAVATPRMAPDTEIIPTAAQPALGTGAVPSRDRKRRLGNVWTHFILERDAEALGNRRGFFVVLLDARDPLFLRGIGAD